MAEPEGDVKRAADLKLWLEGRISELEEELERLKETLGYVDLTLRASTFRPASEMMAEAREPPEVRELKQGGGKKTIALARVTRDGVTIEPSEGMSFKQTTPPFKSYLLAKVLGGMRSADEGLAAGGKIAKGAELKFDVEESDGMISKIIVENYRDKERLNDILSKTSWTLSKMLE